jgi:hypothetical protein
MQSRRQPRMEFPGRKKETNVYLSAPKRSFEVGSKVAWMGMNESSNHATKH